MRYKLPAVCGASFGFSRPPRPEGTPPPEGSTEWDLRNSDSIWGCVECKWVGKGSQLELRPGIPDDFPDFFYRDPNWVECYCPKCGTRKGLRSPLIPVEEPEWEVA